MNWVKTNTLPYMREKAQKALTTAKDNNKGKTKRLVKVCDRPLTYKEVYD